jgi:putative phosphotransacetylase
MAEKEKETRYAELSLQLGLDFGQIRSALVPIGVSGRHLHISEAHLAELFGRGYALHKLRELRQPGEFAAEETVTLVTPQGVIEKVRILGPARSKTQVELSWSDGKMLGLELPLQREETGSVMLNGPAGALSLNAGVMLAKRHLHCTPSLAARLGISDGQDIFAICGEKRRLLFDRILARVSGKYADELHLDTDEANAALVSTGDMALVFGAISGDSDQFPASRQKAGATFEFAGLVLTELEVARIAGQGYRSIRVGSRAIVTPLAWDNARKMKLRIEGKDLLDGNRG